MRTGRRGYLLARVFCKSDEVPVAEMRSAVFMEYTEAELLRMGCYLGRISKVVKRYSCGDDISCDERQILINRGISKVINRLSDRSYKNRIVFDKERQVVRVVRN